LELEGEKQEGTTGEDWKPGTLFTPYVGFSLRIDIGGEARGSTAAQSRPQEGKKDDRQKSAELSWGS